MVGYIGAVLSRLLPASSIGAGLALVQSDVTVATESNSKVVTSICVARKYIATSRLINWQL